MDAALNDIMASDAANPYAKLLPETINLDNDIFAAPTPRGLFDAYRGGQLLGVLSPTSPYPFNRFAEYARDYIKANQPDGTPLVFEDGPLWSQIKGRGAGKRIMGHHAWIKLDPKNAGFGAQATGDCVSWAIRGALDRLRTLLIVLGQWQGYIVRQATCGIYSGRGHTGQGADPVRLSAWAVQIGTLLEQVYETSAGKYDFRNYSEYVKWGMSRGRVGVPDDLLALTKPHTAAGYKVIRTTDAARDFIAAGGTIHVGSDLGVSSTGNPISRRSGSWSHDMDVPGFDATGEFFPECVWIWDQSWGNWNSVTNIPEPWKPILQGMFFLSEKDTQWAMNGGGCVGFLPGKWFPASIDNVI